MDGLSAHAENIIPIEVGTPPATATTTTDITSTEPTRKRVIRPDSQSLVAAVTSAPVQFSKVINPSEVPAFLRCHGKGNRRVDIHDYLNKVKDPRFQQILFNYLRFEIDNKSSANGSLPTASRPPEIVQWTSRARPASLPDFTTGKRTFPMFVDSILTWWASLQPSWRSLERGVVSREISGDWGTLCAPGINGLLNVVILVYWWSRTLDEKKPKDGVRVDYEIFADDVSWVLSNLAT